MDMILLTLIALSILAFGLKVYAPAQYIAFGWLVEAAVRAAEQRYKESGQTVKRRELAKEQIRSVLRYVGINPDKWNAQIDWMIDAAITRLPKTHTATDDPAGIECTE